MSLPSRDEVRRAISVMRDCVGDDHHGLAVLAVAEWAVGVEASRHDGLLLSSRDAETVDPWHEGFRAGVYAMERRLLPPWATTPPGEAAGEGPAK